MMAVLLVLMLGAAAVILYFIVPRSGTAFGRTNLLPGKRLAFRNTSSLPLLNMQSTTVIRWHGQEFTFALVRLPNRVCRAYIVSQPGYLGKPTGLGSTHRLTDTLGRKYVCWTPEPLDPNHMAGALTLWVAATCRYRETGTFPDAHQAAQELNR